MKKIVVGMGILWGLALLFGILEMTGVMPVLGSDNVTKLKDNYKSISIYDQINDLNDRVKLIENKLDIK